MIHNQWYVVLSSKQVKDNPVGVTRLGEKLVFWRDRQGKLGCLRDWCVHRGVALSLGKVIGDHVQCPFHGFEYDLSGQVTLIPANGRNSPVPKAFKTLSYPTYEAHDFIWIWWGEEPPADLKPPRYFEDIDADFSYGEAIDSWDTHYSRAIENQLDVVHLPYVHESTIGRGNQTLVDGPGVKWRGDDMFEIYMRNRVDDGSPLLKPSEFPLEPEPDFKLELILPNLWENHLGDSSRIVVAFVPVDGEHSLLYLRFYQKFVRLPVLRTFVNRLSMPLNKVILHQDRRVVQSQEPKASDWSMDEKLIRGDHPIIEYRRRRAQLQGKITDVN